MTLLATDRRVRALGAWIIPAAITCAAFGQDELDPITSAPAIPAKRTSEFRIGPSVSYQFGGDEFDSILSAGTIFNYHRELKPDLSLDLGGYYRYDDYDFEGGSRLGEAWEAIHTITLRARFNWRLNSDWMVFGGPIFMQAHEDSIEWDIDFDENSLFGGFAGASYRFNDSLLLGAGLSVIDEYQSDARMFPIFILNWEITSDLRISTLDASAEERPGVELIFDLDRNKQIAVGIGYDYSRFRLDDSGLAPDGVGKVTGTPFWGRYTLHLTPKASVTLRVGLIFNGKIELELANGADSDSDRDTAGMIGLSGRIRF